jgi:HSP20 family protein
MGGLLKGLSTLLGLVARMAEEGKEETTRTGEVAALGGQVKGVYGVTLRMGLPGSPVIERFGNVQETESGPVVTETREPLVDALDEGDAIVVIAELPGVEEQDIRVCVDGDVLEVSAASGDRNYRKEVLLPSAVDPKSLRSSYRNGILEVSLTKAQQNN